MFTTSTGRAAAMPASPHRVANGGIAAMLETTNNPNTDSEADAFRIELGKELRRVRELRGWTPRSVFLAVSGLNMPEPTLGSYELGTRTIGLYPLINLCRALEHDWLALLAKVHRKVFGEDDSTQLDLTKLARTTVERLRPLQAWARLRVHDFPTGEATKITLTREALDSMAVLCGIKTDNLARTLVKAGVVNQLSWQKLLESRQ
jgi:hypothetical protein